jgi:hypothetical protein
MTLCYGEPAFNRQQQERGRNLEWKTASLFLSYCVSFKDDNERLGNDLPNIQKGLEYAYQQWEKNPLGSDVWPERDQEFVNAVMKLARFLGFRADFRERVLWGKRGLKVAEAIGAEKAVVELCASTISWPLLQMGDYTAAEYYSNKGYAMAVEAQMWQEAGLAARTLSGIARDRSTAQPKDNAETAQQAILWARRA